MTNQDNRKELSIENDIEIKNREIPILEVKQGCFSYLNSQLVLKDISFSLQKGEILTILGQNGIGKTTLLKCITGIMKWTSGSSFILNNEVTGDSEESKLITYVPQAKSLSFPYTVEEVVMMGRAKHIGIFGTPRNIDKAIVKNAMDQVGIYHLKDALSTQLSGGQLQLVFIARALAGEHKILVLDEPESYLDFKNQSKILKLINDLVIKYKLTCLINTHYPDHALRISDKTLLLGHLKYSFGKTPEIITEESMEEYFGIKTKIISLNVNGKDIPVFTVI